jgi:hypothetical protein
MLEMPGPDMTWDIENTGPEGRFISKEAFDMLRDHFTTWVVSRFILRDNAGLPAKHPKVTVTVEWPE